MFDSVLIANRGEIAVRIARTARRMGMRVIAVASDADWNALHARSADERHLLKGQPRAAYLDINHIIAVARQSGADCIHPGYGFLSENPEFAEACDKADLTFVGPPASAIRAMGHKHSAKRIMGEAGVPLAPGYQGDEQGADFLAERARETGFPLMLKAVAGGGGKGMRLVESEADFDAALAACQREALASFSDDRVLIEKYVPDARHIEVQIMADRHGNCVHLMERDCSLQRRHQKVIEEAPAPGMTAKLRAMIGEAAVNGAKAVGYVGAGTVEFIASSDLSSIYFMEMNTRLQVEHPVTEMITGLDLVELQFRVAAGEPLPMTQEDVARNGHAIEARLYAEDPAQEFLPQSGKLMRLQWPPETPDVRIESGVEEGSVITPFYDPMIAKLVAHGKTRKQAMKRLAAALGGTTVVGLRTNQRFLMNMLADSNVTGGSVTTGFIAKNMESLANAALDPAVRAAAAATWFDGQRKATGDPWQQGNWSLTGLPRKDIAELVINGELARHESQDAEYQSLAVAASCWDPAAGKLYLTCDSIQLDVMARDQLSRTPAEQDGAAQTKAPMTGRIIRVMAAEGDEVRRGDPVLVIEAMKMEHVLRAGIDGKIASLKALEGETVREGDELCAIEPVTPSTGT